MTTLLNLQAIKRHCKQQGRTLRPEAIDALDAQVGALLDVILADYGPREAHDRPKPVMADRCPACDGTGRVK